jgi:hypothetical protein
VYENVRSAELSTTEDGLPELSVTVGATFATDTVWLSVLPVAPSESVALTLTTLEAPPSGNTHLKLPVVFVLVSDPETF